MRLVHLADLHIGHRRGKRVTKTGINQREADVAATLTAVIDRVIAVAPDVIVIAGDIFDTARPSNYAIVHSFAQFSRLRSSLPATKIVTVFGNHDVPREPTNGSIMGLFATLGVHVANRSMAFEFPELDLSVLGVPDIAGLQRPELRPNPAFRFNVACIHGEVQGMPRKGGAPANEIKSADVGPEAWDYVALGHWHCHRVLAPNMAYCGAMDYVSSDPWSELRDEAEAGQVGKVFVERNLVTGEHTLHAIPTIRRFVDCPTIDARGMGVEQLREAVCAALESATVDGACVRLVVTNAAFDVRRAVNASTEIRALDRRALVLNLDIRTVDPMERIRNVTTERKQQLASPTFLRDLVGRKLADRELAADVHRDEFIATGMGLFDRASEQHNEKGIARDPEIEPQLVASIDATNHPLLQRTA